MKFPLEGYRLHLVFCPVDMRSGYPSLSTIALACLDIDVAAGRDCVVFVSSRRTICKAIWADEAGGSILTRRLRQGRFQKLLARIGDGGTEIVDTQELLTFLDGGNLLQERAQII